LRSLWPPPITAPESGGQLFLVGKPNYADAIGATHI
jgi:hypothetical protein